MVDAEVVSFEDAESLYVTVIMKVIRITEEKHTCRFESYSDHNNYSGTKGLAYIFEKMTASRVNVYCNTLINYRQPINGNNSFSGNFNVENIMSFPTMLNTAYAKANVVVSEEALELAA